MNLCGKGLFHVNDSVFPVLHTTTLLIYTLYTLNFSHWQKFRYFHRRANMGLFITILVNTSVCAANNGSNTFNKVRSHLYQK